MKAFPNWLLRGLRQRLMILLEHEPCDAVQNAYFEVLGDMRRELAAEPRQTEPNPVRRTENPAPEGAVYRTAQIR